MFCYKLLLTIYYIFTYQILGIISVHVSVGESHHELDVVDDGVRYVVQVHGCGHCIQNLLQLK